MTKSTPCLTTCLFNEHHKWIYQQVYRMTRSEWLADEIVQEVFLKVWIHRDKLSGIQDLKSWLHIIARRTVFNYIIRISREKNFLATLGRNNAAAQLEDILLATKCRRLLSAAEEELSPRQKQVYYLRFIKGMDRKGIASKLQIAEITAVHHMKSSMSIVRRHVLASLEMDNRKIA